MIVREIMGEFVKTYSDRGMIIRQSGTGDLYSEAIDLLTSPVTYVETDIPIDEDDSAPTIEDKAEGYDILLGVKE